MTSSPTRQNYSDLFDMTTVTSNPQIPPKRIGKEIVKCSKLVIQGKTTVVVEEDVVSYFEVSDDDNDDDIPPRLSQSRSDGNLLRLNYSRGCGRDRKDTDHFVMPSLRLHYMEDHEYQEPTRDRDKNWILDSQRDILNKEHTSDKNVLV